MRLETIRDNLRDDTPHLIILRSHTPSKKKPHIGQGMHHGRPSKPMLFQVVAQALQHSAA